MKRWILAVLLLVAPFAQAGLECSEAVTASVKLEQFHAKTDRQVEKLIQAFNDTVKPTVLSGQETPKWSDFDALSKILDSAKLFQDTLRSNPKTAAELKDLSKELKKQLLENAGIQKLLQLQSTADKEHQYQPTEYELKRAYQFYVRELNQILPRELRIPLKPLPADQRRVTMNTEAAQYLKISEEKFAAKFAQSPNGTYEEYVKVLRASTDPHVIKALEILDKDQVQVTMRRPESARFWLPKVGFHNQFVTGSSKGMLSHEWRNVAETNLYGQESLEAYSRRDAEFKPKYGTLTVMPESGLKNDLQSSKQYGTDFYFFKTESLQSRLTLYPNDSLNIGMGGGKVADDSRPWESFLIPWKFRLLAVPFMIRSMEKNEFGQPTVSPLIATNGVFNYCYYWETQILGSVRLDDVATFAFTQSPPEGEFLQELLRRHIQIRQLKDDYTLLDWSPPISPSETTAVTK